MADPIPAELLGEAPFSDEQFDLWLAVQDGPDQYGVMAVDAAREAIGLDEPVPAVTRWEVTDLGSAAWAMARLAAIDAEARRLNAQADEWAAAIAEWRERATRGLVRRREFFNGHLERWGLLVRLEDPEVKSVNLPNGVISTRAHKAQVVITDPDGLAKWLLDAGRYEALSVKPLVAKVREMARIVDDDGEGVAVTEDGEPVPCVTIEPASITVSVKPTLP